MKKEVKEAGILLHISSLPSEHGIGTLGKEAYRFADFLAEAGQKYWQVLPLGVTGYGNSPYQCASSFAGNHYFIDLDLLSEEGLIEKHEYQNINWGGNPERVDFGQIYRHRGEVLSLAAKRFNKQSKDYIRFCKKQAPWLDDYALYMAIKESFGMASFDNWDKDLTIRKPEALAAFAAEHKERIDYYKVTQYFFYKQHFALKAYLSSKGIKLIGDIPSYTAYDSADVWANPRLFELDENLKCKRVAGVPPDAFSETGQLWGNPLYNFEEMGKDNFAWLKSRILHALTLCDIVRVDHFRAFESYYAIPEGSKDATAGEWIEGPGIGFFKSLKMDKSRIIAEDLGIITDKVRELIEKTGFKGMKVLQFAFDGRKDNEYLARNFKNSICIVYTGTHDNDTTKGWFYASSHKERFGIIKSVPEMYCYPPAEALIRYAMKSKASLAVIPMQDYLDLGSEARMNTPATAYGNWEWRLNKGYYNKELIGYIKKLTKLRKR